MSEATEFFGVVQRVSPSSTHPFRWRRRKDPEAGDVEYYPVLTSRVGAKAFVRAAGHLRAYDVAIGSQGEELLSKAPPLQQMLADIRPLERSEISLDHRVLRDPVYRQYGPDFVTWADILAEGE
jgi:hypothetical protein